jgi:hypothetical protein
MREHHLTDVYLVSNRIIVDSGFDVFGSFVDFRRLYVIHQAGAFFVTRTISNMKYHRVYSRAVDKTTGVGSDESIVLDGFIRNGIILST